MKNLILDLPAKYLMGRGIDKKFPILVELYKKAAVIMAKKGEAEVTLPLGAKLLVSNKDAGMGLMLRTKGVFEGVQTEMFIKEVKKGNTVFDIGANNGYYSVIASKLVGSKGRVYAFEPDPQNITLLKKNIKLNNCKNVIVIPLALGSESGSLRLTQDFANPGESSFSKDKKGNKISVRVETLDSFCKQKNIKKVDVINLDVEGSEIEVLKGSQLFLQKSKGLKLFAEINPKALKGFASDEYKFTSLLKALGFSIEKLIDEKSKKVRTFSENVLVKTLASTGFVGIYALKNRQGLSKKPLVSVLMTAFNAAPYIKEAINSVLRQTYTNLELIIVDDGSKDKTYEVAKKYEKVSSKVRVYKLGKNIGPSTASEYGLKRAKGELIARMDADDITVPNRVEKQVNFLLKNPDTVVIGGQCTLIDEQNKLIGKKIFPTKNEDIYNALFTMNPIQHPTVMINTLLVPKKHIYYHNHGMLAHDLELLYELAKFGKFANLNDVVLYYRQYSTSLSLRNPKKTFFDTLKIRYKAVAKYNYKPTIRGVLVNLVQTLVVLVLPNRVIYPLFRLIRDASFKTRLQKLLSFPKLNNSVLDYASTK